MSSSTSIPNVTQLFHAAHEDGDLSGPSLQALQVQADIGQQIQAGLGVAPDDVRSSQVVLVTMMPDDSGSIRFQGNAQLVRDGHNLVLDALARSAQRDDVLVHTRYLNGEVLYPYRNVDGAPRMTSQNYDPNQGTPLYDQIAVLLGTVLVKTRELEDAGIPVRSVSLILTDGADEHSTRQKPHTLRPLVEDMLRKETHIVAAMGISDGSTDFRRVFRDIGIPDAWILTPGNTATEIRRAFQTFSQSAVRASQSAGSFSKTALGGFGN
ncbi:MAG: hypothetical protein U0166_04590 [Acidobacteriota bacterium]